MVQVCKYAEKQTLAHQVGQYILERQDQALEGDSKAQFNVAISGGSLVNVLRSCLVEDAQLAPRVQWARWHVFFCDERLVPLDHADSNYGAFKKAVLNPLSHRGNHLNLGPTVYAINEALLNEGEHHNAKIAAEYESLLPAAGFDLLLLGCGPDGHTCSLFPGEPHRALLDESTKQVAWCSNSPKPPANRITFTLPTIARARNIAFVAEGASKQPVMHQIFDNHDLTLPTALINARFGPKVHWFVDDAAFAAVQDSTVLSHHYQPT